MDKRSAIVLLVVGLVQCLPPIAMLTFFRADGFSLFPIMSYALLWLVVSGPSLVLWGVVSLLWRKP